ncbi:34843_t:CDS:1, partial [Gigaspora margarita]
TCDVCQHQDASQLHKELHPLQIGASFNRVGIDIVSPFKDIIEKKNQYIIVATKYLAKWPEAWSIPDMIALTIA